MQYLIFSYKVMDYVGKIFPDFLLFFSLCFVWRNFFVCFFHKYIIVRFVLRNMLFCLEQHFCLFYLRKHLCCHFQRYSFFVQGNVLACSGKKCCLLYSEKCLSLFYSGNIFSMDVFIWKIFCFLIQGNSLVCFFWEAIFIV